MDPVSFFPAIASLLAAVTMAFLLVARFGEPAGQGRYVTIDGLRGYLALFVFLHHACIWYYFMRTGVWRVPPSNLYTHFGQGSVLLFFMITGFLFFSKLIDGRDRGIDWARLFISRFLRLVPLYLFAMCLLFLAVAYISGGVLHEPLPTLFKNLMQWIGFTIMGAPNLNGVNLTSLIVAGVTWSLPYEWYFYFLLPVLALTVGVVSPLPYLMLSLVSIAGLVVWHPPLIYFVSFLGGIASAFLVRSEGFRTFSARKTSSFIALGCIAIAIIFFPSANGYAQIFLLAVAFALIACGNNMFGLLIHPVSRMLGEMAYGIYLLHGIILFVMFYFVIGLQKASNLSVLEHWILIVCITPIIILANYLTFRFIENPAMRSTARVTAWIRSCLPMPESKK